jgi:hypothetical protein
MSSQRIRPSPADLAELDIDLDAPAFTEWELNNNSEVPAVTVSRVKPPKITTTTTLPRKFHVYILYSEDTVTDMLITLCCV